MRRLLATLAIAPAVVLVGTPAHADPIVPDKVCVPYRGDVVCVYLVDNRLAVDTEPEDQGGPGSGPGRVVP